MDKHAEQQLALRASRGDRDAFGELHERTFDRICWYITRGAIRALQMRGLQLLTRFFLDDRD